MPKYFSFVRNSIASNSVAMISRPYASDQKAIPVARNASGQVPGRFLGRLMRKTTRLAAMMAELIGKSTYGVNCHMEDDPYCAKKRC